MLQCDIFNRFKRIIRTNWPPDSQVALEVRITPALKRDKIDREIVKERKC